MGELLRVALVGAIHLASSAAWGLLGLFEKLEDRLPTLAGLLKRFRRFGYESGRTAMKLYTTVSWARANVMTVLLLSTIATVDMVIGHPVSFRLFYVLPIWIAARLAGIGPGFIAMFLVGIFLSFTDSQFEDPTGSAIIVNFAVRWIGLATFLLIVVHIESALKVALQQATHDPLTGLPNRGMIERFAERHIESAPTSRMHVAVIDCDRFKQINDTHGHAFGDHALRVVAKKLEAAVRDMGVVGRIGGDEFVVFFRDTERFQAEMALVRADATFRKIMSSLSWDSGLSFGIATLGVDGECFQKLCRVADERMYVRKGHRQATAIAMIPLPLEEAV